MTGPDYRTARTAGDFSREEVARKLNKSAAWLQRLEEEKREAPSGFEDEFRQALVELDEDRRQGLLAAVGAH